MYNVLLAVKKKKQIFIVLYVQCTRIYNYMFRPILSHLQVVSYSLESEVSYRHNFACRTPHSLGYTKQPEDGLK